MRPEPPEDVIDFTDEMSLVEEHLTGDRAKQRRLEILRQLNVLRSTRSGFSKYLTWL